MARYLVTGVAGFIGSHLVAALLVAGDEVLREALATEAPAAGDRRELAPLAR